MILLFGFVVWVRLFTTKEYLQVKRRGQQQGALAAAARKNVVAPRQANRGVAAQGEARREVPALQDGVQVRGGLPLRRGLHVRELPGRPGGGGALSQEGARERAARAVARLVAQRRGSARLDEPAPVRLLRL